MTEHNDRPSFVYVTYIATTEEALWAALTRPEFTEKYWGGRRVASEWRVGAPIEYRYDGGRKRDIVGEVLEVDPPRRLAYTFATDDDCKPSGREPPSRVTFELKRLGAVVRLTLTHDRFIADSEVYEGVRNGWPGILSNLKTLLESGRPLNFAWNERTGEAVAAEQTA